MMSRLTLSQYANMEHREHFFRSLASFPHPWHFTILLNTSEISLTLSLRDRRPLRETGNICLQKSLIRANSDHELSRKGAAVP